MLEVHGASLWTSPEADAIAYEIAALGGIYCGPTAIAWIAAVWNRHRGRPYDVRTRLLDKGLFANGPRLYRRRLPFFADGLHETLLRETEGELGLESRTLRRTKSIHRALDAHDMPIILRIRCPRILQGLHYTTLFRSRRQLETGSRIHFDWMDNGLYGIKSPGHPAFFERRDLRAWSFFWLGCKQVVQLRGSQDA